MPSVKSRVVLFLLKHRHLFRLQLRRAAIDAATPLADLRRRADASASRFGRVPPEVRTTEVTLGNCVAEWLRPPGADRQRAMLYFHGGGYVMGSRQSHRGVVAKLAAASGLNAVLFDYRLAPEHPYPAALDDALSVYAALLAHGHPASGIVFAGDSAGGGLCLATLLALRDRGLPLPSAAAVMSPWTDLTCSSPSYDHPDPLAPAGSWRTFSAHYAGATPASTPLISPLFGELAGLPPLLIYAGADESMRDDSVRFTEKAKAASVDVRLHVGAGMVHCYPVFSPMFPEAKHAMDDICAFLRRLSLPGPA